MKKIISILAIIIIALCSNSCCKFQKNGNNAYTGTDSYYNRLGLVEIEFRGETHEYLFYLSGQAGSMSHWEGCKYCKSKNK